jgi:lipid-binding SYLF domain-containing protein
MKLDTAGTKLVVALTVTLLVASSGSVVAQDEKQQSWKSLKHEAKRQKIDEMADEALAELFTKSIKAKALYEKAYGWAAFDNLKLAFGFSGGGGNGVAIDTSNDTRTYMKMGTVGFGLGLGGQKYQVIFLFQDRGTFLNFVENGWQADAGARAAAGTSGVNAQTAFVNGLAVYQMTDKGLMANVDIAGTKYWKNKKLNR